MGPLETGKPSSPFARLAGWALTTLSRGLHWLDGSDSERWGSEYLQGPFAPVDREVFEQDLEVVAGALPEALRGAFVRDGPNPKLPPMGGYHWFDGDGMVHAVTLGGDGSAAYCSRWVATARLAQEQRIGVPLAVKIGDSRGRAALLHMAVASICRTLGLLSDEEGNGKGNTALAFHAGRLLALHETHLPYALQIACSGLVENLGRVTFGGKVQHAFTAHPKRDPETGELFYFGYSVRQQPYYEPPSWYGWLDAQGRVVRDFPVPLREPVMMHDMALTQRYALLLDVPLVFDPKAMVRDGGLPFVHKKRPLRIGVLPRYAASADEIRWFETEPAMAFHVANAWEEGDTIRLFLCPSKEFSLSQFQAGEDTWPHLCEITIDTGAGTCSALRRLCALPAEFPVVPAALVGRPCRYAYVGTMVQDGPSGVPVFDGVAKVDLQAPGEDAGLVAVIKHGGQRLGGEAYFVPSPAASDMQGPGRAAPPVEDDGYLMTFVTDAGTGESELVVYDAASMSAAPVARLRIPHRVPLGFHCTWVTDAELASQSRLDA